MNRNFVGLSIAQYNDDKTCVLKVSLISEFSTVFLFIAGLTTLNAQEVGIRFGEMTGNNVAVDGVFSLG